MLRVSLKLRPGSHNDMISSAVITLVLTFTLLSVSPVAQSLKRYDVVIVGAGVAGIAAGQQLLQNNLSNILILEARGRIGGRIHTVKFGGETVDLGAQYVYAFQGNSVYDLSSDLGLYYTGPERKSKLVSWGGHLLNKTILNQLMKLSVHPENHDNNSYLKYWFPKMSEYLGSKRVNSKDGMLYLDSGRKLFSIHNGADADDVSAWGVSRYRESSYGRSKMWTNGFQTLTKVLMGEVGNKTRNRGLARKILRNKVVVGVDWNDAGVAVSCSDDTVYLADKVVITLPLGVLKTLPKTYFNPPLPSEKLNVIRNLGIGYVDKIFIKLDEELTQDKNVLFAMDSEMKKEFAQTERQGTWPTRLTGVCPTRDSASLINTWLVGDDTVTMETLPLAQVTEGLRAVVKTLLGTTMAQPKAVLRSKWATDPFSLGSYSYRSVDTETYNVSHGQLAQPILNSHGLPVVLFAGEATSEVHYGTVHGAMESGLSAATTILHSFLHNS